MRSAARISCVVSCVLFGLASSAGASGLPPCLVELAPFHSFARTANEWPWLADVTGDGRIDLVTLDDAEVGRVYVNDGSGLSTAAAFQLPAHSHLAAFRDFDGDGRADLLSWTANYYWCNSNSLRILWNTGNPAAPFDPAIATVLPLPANPFCIGPEPIDFNGDGRLDIILTNMPYNPGAPSNWPSRMYRNDGNRQIAVQNDLIWPRDLGGRGTQDFDGDGKADFLAMTKSGWADGLYGVYFRRGNGDGSFQAAQTYFTSPRTAHGFEIDRNGPDTPGFGFGVYVGTTITQTLHLGRWTGSGFAFDTLSLPAPLFGRQGLDLSGDGFHDLVLGSPVSAGKLAVIANDGAGNFPGEATILLEFPNFEFLAMAREPEATEAGADGVYAIAVSSGTIAVFRTACDFTPPDCDGDGLSDAEAIAAGATDANGNGVPDTCDCPADANQDGEVSAEDLSVVLFAWGMSGAKVSAADVNRDGSVDGEDLSAVLAAWGPCPPK